MSGYGSARCCIARPYAFWYSSGPWSRSNIAMNNVSVRNGCAPSANSFDVVVLAQRRPLLVGEGEPGGLLRDGS